MGYRIDANYEIDAIIMNRTPDNCEVCPFYGYSLKGDDIGCCTVLDIQMTTDNAWREYSGSLHQSRRPPYREEECSVRPVTFRRTYCTGLYSAGLWSRRVFPPTRRHRGSTI